MRRNNTLSWRWDYLSACPAHCLRILFSLLIACIQRLAQDDPIYQHNLLFSLLSPQPAICAEVVARKVEKTSEQKSNLGVEIWKKKRFALIFPANVCPLPLWEAASLLPAEIIQFNIIHGIFLSCLKCRSSNKSSSFSKGSDVLRKCIWIEPLIMEEACQHQSLWYSLLMV